MNILLLLCLSLVVASSFLWRNTLRTRFSSVAAATLIFSSILFAGTYFFIDFLTGLGIDESVVYYLSAGFGGAAILDFWVIIIGAIAYIFVAAMILIYAAKSFRTDQVPQWAKTRTVAALITVTASFYLNPAFGEIQQLVSDGFNKKSDQAQLIPESFVLVEKVDLPEQPKNFVYLFLESLERTYLDETIFPGLMPNLKALEAKSLSFTNIQQAYSTNWTISGMTSGLCGMPLIGSAGNSMSRVDQFLPGASCIGDLLDPYGYELNYLGGASLDFAGKGNFFKSHSFDRVEGREELLELQDDPDYLSSWGIYDDRLYDIATNRLNSLAASEQPFGLVLQTVDTHNPNGYLSNACEGLEYQDGSNPILNAVHCADVMAGKFIDQIRNNPEFENTVLVVSSDHLAMRNTAWDQLESGERRNLLMFFGKDIEAGVNRRAASTLDVGPTLLSLIGADVKSFGFGRDLLRNKPTLSEEETPIKDVLVAGYTYLASLWSFAQLDQGIVMDFDSERVILGERSIGYPTLMLLNRDLSVSETRFDFYGGYDLSNQITLLLYNQRFIWVDYCSKTAQLGVQTEARSDSYCAVFAALGANKIESIELGNNTEIPFKQIQDYFSSIRISPTTSALRLEGIERYKLFGVYDVIQYEPENLFSGQIYLRSSGFGTGKSLVSNRTTEQTIKLARGITVVGLTSDAAPTKLAHFDTCGWAGVLQDVNNSYDSIQETLTGYRGLFSGFAVVVDDSAICLEPVELGTLFEGSGLTRWREIEFRTPYIGLIAANGEVMEYLGKEETSIAVEASEFLREAVDFQRQLDTLPRIAHASGIIEGARYTNSIDALNLNKDSYSLIEIDLNWTTDNQLVCLHDWEATFRKLFSTKESGPVSLAEFENLIATQSKFQVCTLDTLADWLRENGDKRVVTDIKARTLDAIELISEKYPDVKDQFVPQIYQPTEYPHVRSLGFSDIMWTLYRYNGSDDSVLSWLRFMDLYGLVMPDRAAGRGLAQKATRETGVLSWVATVNTQSQLNELQALGVTEIMTDSLVPTTD